MNSILAGIAAAIDARRLPETLAEIFAPGQSDRPIGDDLQLEFHEETPHNLLVGRGAAVVCSAIAFHNTRGGILVFGAGNSEFDVARSNQGFNLEVLNWVLSNWVQQTIPTITATYPHPSEPGATVEVVLVPPRQGAPLLRLRQGLGRFDGGIILVRDGAHVVAAELSHFDVLCQGGMAPDGHHTCRALPPLPSAPSTFVGRGEQMAQLLQWLTQDNSRRLFLTGPAGAGTTRLAAEFGRRLCAPGAAPMLSGGGRLDQVLTLSRPDSRMGMSLDSDPISNQSLRILQMVGALGEDSGHKDREWIEQRLGHFLSTSNSLIIVESAEADAFEERLFVKILAARGRNRLLYTHSVPNASPLDPCIVLSGFTADAEYSDFFELCATRFEVPAPEPNEYALIAQATGGLPGLIETVFQNRRHTPNWSAATRLIG